MVLFTSAVYSQQDNDLVKDNIKATVKITTPVIIMPGHGTDATPTEALVISGDSAKGAPYQGPFYDSDRAIKRTEWPTTLNPAKDSIQNLIDWLLYPFIPATISIAGCGAYEIGTDNLVTISGSVTANDETDFTLGHMDRTYPTVSEITTWADGSAGSFSENLQFYPLEGGTASNTASYTAYNTTGNDGTPAIINSGACYLYGVYPYFYGFSASDYTAGGTSLYSGLTKLVQVYEASSEVEVASTTLKYIYIAYPASYGYLTSIKDQNEFEWLPSFTVHVANVSSTGLDTDWLNHSYNIYRSNNTFTTDGLDWTFTFEHVGTLGASSGTIAATDSVVAGTYEAGTLLTTANTITIPVSITAPGTYSITSNEVNGYNFTGTGTFTTIDDASVTLYAEGTPVAAQTDSFTITYGVSTCVVDVTVSSP